VEQWKEAVRRCYEEFKKPSYQRSPLMYGRDIAECIDGLVSEECGGNPVGGKKQLKVGHPHMSQKVTSMDDGGEPPALERAREAWRSDRFEEAIEICTDYLIANPPHFSAYVWRAHSLHALQRYDEAFDDWAACIALNPDREIPYFHLGEALHYLGRYEEAIDAYNRAEARFPDFNMHTIKWYRALCLIELERFAEAKLDVDRLPTDKNIFKRIRADLMRRMARDH
jgi:tetratricopeptide (TPR) repeat protein